ncbi:MAG: hypothetical protein AAFX99_05060 [Myxococcota bacterium]
MKHTLGLMLLLAVCAACGSDTSSSNTTQDGGVDPDTSADTTPDGAMETSPSNDTADAGDTMDTATAMDTPPSNDMGDGGLPYELTTRPVSPRGGFVSSIAFASDGEQVVLSADDASGLFMRQPGQTAWSRLPAPLNWSCYDLVVLDEGATLIAPNHFGRGFAFSRDGGQSFVQSPLPNDAGLVWATVALPRGSDQPPRVLLATDGGILITDDWGATFLPSTAALGDAVPQALIIGPGGTLYAGDSQGGIHASNDEGATFQTRVAPTDEGIPITSLAATPHALYIGYGLGFVGRMANFEPGRLELINDGLSGQFTSALWTVLAAIPGDTMAQDTLWAGTVFRSSELAWGLFVSRDGGDTFTARNDQLEGNSVFTLAINPTNPDHLLVGSVNGAVFETLDGGQTFVDTTDGIIATAALAVAIDPADPNRLALSSTSALPGTGATFTTDDGGQTWTRLGALDLNDILAIHRWGDSLLLGAIHAGILRSQDGGATFANVLSIDAAMRRFSATADHNSILAITDLTLGNPDITTAGLYRSTDQGQSWTLALAGPFLDLERSPLDQGTLVMTGLDAVAVDRDGLGEPVELGLTPLLTPETFVTAVGIAPDDPEFLLTGDSTGRLYRAQGCSSAAAPCSWEAIDSPAQMALISGIEGVLVEGQRIWVMTAWVGDRVNPSAIPGIWISDDDGATWHTPHESVSTLAWSLERSPTPGEFLVGRWGGGALELRVAPRSE